MSGYWFADVDPDGNGDDYRWQPYLQLDGVCLSFDIWFKSEGECREFIAGEVIGARLEDS